MDENKRILVIDDDEAVRDTYTRIFASEKDNDFLKKGANLFEKDTGVSELNGPDSHYEVHQASDGSMGIESVKDSINRGMPFAAAFIDMKMPGIKGDETARRIWEIDPDIRIVIVTAYSEFNVDDIVASIGRNDLFYLRKPFNHEEIKQFARALVNEWNLEKERQTLDNRLNSVNKTLEDINKNLQIKVEKQAAMIVQADKMASIGVLAAGVAHEINNPVTFVNTNLSALKDYCSVIEEMNRKCSAVLSFMGNLNNIEADKIVNDFKVFKEENDFDSIMKDIVDIAEESIEGIRRVKTIVSDLKSFSRIDNSLYGSVDINDAIDKTVKMLKTEIKNKAEIKKEYGDIPYIQCYPQKMSQVFMNLILNASQAIKGRGSIRIATSMVKKDEDSDEELLKIVIEDDGEGIPKENISKLFEPFFTTKPVGEGTGLGLSIVYDIIKAHNGSIMAESEPGKGSRFIIMLPEAVNPD